MQYIKLRNNIKMPMIGYGTARLLGNECYNSVKDAIKAGYRHFDTASMYNNEAFVGKAIYDSGIPRNEFFITTKLYHVTNNYDLAIAQINKSLEDLKTDYIDLLLIHEPFIGDDIVYKAIIDEYKKGKVKAIGVSNFNIEYLNEFINKVDIIPMVNQVECHPYFQELKLQEYMKQYGIIMESYSPFTSSVIDIDKDKALLEISNRYNKSIRQIILRYLIQKGIPSIPKTSKIERMKENIDVFSFELSNEDINIIEGLDLNKSLFGWY